MLDAVIRRGSARRDADRVIGKKPLVAQIIRRLDMMHPRTKAPTGFDQFVSVVAVRAANDDDHAAFLRELDGRALALFRRPTDGVNETHFGIWKTFADQPDEPPHFVDRLGGLRNEWFFADDTVGITAGTSTPDDSIQ